MTPELAQRLMTEARDFECQCWGKAAETFNEYIPKSVVRIQVERNLVAVDLNIEDLQDKLNDAKKVRESLVAGLRECVKQEREPRLDDQSQGG